MNFNSHDSLLLFIALTTIGMRMCIPQRVDCRHICAPKMEIWNENSYRTTYKCAFVQQWLEHLNGKKLYSKQVCVSSTSTHRTIERVFFRFDVIVRANDRSPLQNTSKKRIKQMEFYAQFFYDLIFIHVTLFRLDFQQTQLFVMKRPSTQAQHFSYRCKFFAGKQISIQKKRFINLKCRKERSI